MADTLSDLCSYDYDSDIGYLNNLPAYNLFAGADRMLDLSRQVALSGGYYPLIVPFPNAGNIQIGAGQQLSGVIQVPKGSILVMLTTWSELSSNFLLRVYDKATGLDLYNSQWGYNTTIAQDMEVQGNGTDPTFGPYLFTDPYIVLDPNSLQITVLNADQVNSQKIQAAFYFAVPFGELGNGIDAIVTGGY